jgi:hypothetical protein
VKLGDEALKLKRSRRRANSLRSNSNQMADFSRSNHLDGANVSAQVVGTSSAFSTYAIPASSEVSRFLARREAEQGGLELPLTLRDAAEYIDLPEGEVASLATIGVIPAVLAGEGSSKKWMFYLSELKHWLDEEEDGGAPCQLL